MAQWASKLNVYDIGFSRNLAVIPIQYVKSIECLIFSFAGLG